MKSVFACLALFLLSGCSSVGLFLANLPAHTSSLEIIRSVSYGAKPEHTLDIYQPKQQAGVRAPVLVFVYGGRWQSGAKEDYAFVGHAFAKRGYVVVIPDYGKYPATRFPGFAQDIAAATAWTYQNITQYGGNPDLLFLSGHSAGAQLAALVTVDERYLAAHQLDSRNIIRGFAGLAGPYDFTPIAEDIKLIFPPETYHDMKVTNFVEANSPPLLLLHGKDDEVVEPYKYERVIARAQEVRATVKAKVYPGIDHVWMVASLAWFGGSKTPLAEDMDVFFKKIIASSQGTDQSPSLR